MDASRLLNNDESNCTATSMYLSFDDDYTISTSFKTLDTINEMNDASNSTAGNSEKVKNKDFSNLLDDKNFLVNSPLKSVNSLGNNYNSPIKSVRKSMREFKAVSSTPSDGHFLKTATAMSDDGNQTLNNDLVCQAAVPETVVTKATTSGDNKENVTPEIEEAMSILSLGETACSTIEKTVTAMPNEDENQCNSDASNNHNPDNNKKEFVKKCLDLLPDDNNLNGEKANLKDDDDERKHVDLNEGKENSKTINTKVESSSSQCVKPSRILPPGYRKTIFQVNNKHNDDTNSNDASLETELSSLLDKMVKMTNTNNNKSKMTKTKVTTARSASATTTTTTMATTAATTTTTNRMTIIKETKLNNKTKESATKPMPALSGNTRRHPIMSRPSVVVKTTLNSPARKAARRSFANGMSSIPQHPRRSVLPLKSQDNVKLGNANRRTMLPKTNNIVPTAATTTNSRLQVQGHVITSTSNDNPIKTAQPDISFVCNVCKEKFRIKSLMDAHKRSHEVDIPNVSSKKKSANAATTAITAAATAMPPPTARTLIFGHNNQCKYCDKKFALLRALHIHLLQNCSKIPPADKRKLHFTEMDHVNKAQLPSFGNFGLNKSETKRSVENSRESISGTISKEASSSTSSLDSCNKSKQIPAHSGVVFTPRKLILCHSCKLKFKSILDYTDHNISVHCNKPMAQQPIFE